MDIEDIGGLMVEAGAMEIKRILLEKDGVGCLEKSKNLQKKFYRIQKKIKFFLMK